MTGQPKTVLLCTVGGSHEPIIQAIRSAEPYYICFFCTGPDPATKKPGSERQISGKGSVIKETPGDDKPTLTNIPTQLKLSDSSFETCIVPADDLGRAVTQMHRKVTMLVSKYPNARFIADYTGGTKTMSAALVCVALDREELDLRMVSGSRTSLEKVKQGTGQTLTASMAGLRLMLSLQAWRRYAYHEAARGLSAIQLSVDSPDTVPVTIARDMSEALARWDAFDHAGAFNLLEDYGRRISKAWPSMLPDLKLLVNKDNSRQAPMLILDLWLNAERRASQGRFDDAVARLYRLIEWTAQWQLRAKLGIETADVPPKKLPKSVEVAPGLDGRIRLGLWHSWQVAAEHLGEPMAGLVAGGAGRKLSSLLEIRNHSILAHGEKPVDEDHWLQMRDWMKDNFFPVFDQLASDVGLRSKPEQLPRELPESVLAQLED